MRARIYDEWLANTFEGKSTRQTFEFRQHLMEHRIFEPDVEAVRYVARSANIQPRDLLPLLRFARLPFEKVWIEDNTPERLRTYEQMGTLNGRADADDMFRVSFSLARRTDTCWKMTVMPSLKDLVLPKHLSQFFLGFSVIVDTEYGVAPIHDDSEIAGLFNLPEAHANDVVSTKALGYLWRDTAVSPEYRKLLNHIKVQFTMLDSVKLFPKIERDLATMAMSESFVEVGGVIRYAIVFLSTVNLVQTSYTPTRENATRIMVGRRSVPYMKGSTVTINIPSKPLQKLARASAAGWKNRAHEVRGHWRKHLDRDSGETIWKWIKEQKCRGDASLGWVNHDYRVHRT